jgi:hypothetical protein
MTYLETLSQQLAEVGIRGRRRSRILTEFTDHLGCDPDAELGAPDELARQFADQLGTSLARRAAFVSFAGLAVAGLLLGVGFLAGQKPFASASNASPALAYVGAVVAIVAAQVAFVAGVLGALRALRRRESAVVCRAEAVMIVRRAAVGLGAGVVTMVGFALEAIALNGQAPGWWVTLALSLSGAGVITLLAAAPSVLAAARLRPVASGSAGDLYEDFGPFVPPPLRGRPWTFALTVAAGLAIVAAVAGVVQSDPFDGALRGVADGAACLAGFAVFGRYLGLRT